MTKPQQALQRAINAAGGQSELARRIKTTQRSVWYWLNQAKHCVPAHFAQKIEDATGIPKYELRPDLWQPP